MRRLYKTDWYILQKSSVARRRREAGARLLAAVSFFSQLIVYALLCMEV